ncbi:MAG TPA: amidohydrolase family protein [Verrucomicrobiae bacterium]|nr:amidohydrolase family protein [Verrucomicrobiae bacterium]
MIWLTSAGGLARAFFVWFDRMIVRKTKQNRCPGLRPAPGFLGAALLGAVLTVASAAQLNPEADAWRAAHRFIDMHQHIDFTTQHLARAVKILDAVGIGMAVNLSGDTVTPGPGGGPSAFESNKRLADTLFPGRFLQYMNLDYANWEQPDFPAQAVKQVEEGYRLGAAGFKEFKRLGLFLRDGGGRLLRVDDPKLDPMWERLGELNMPVSIHVADPRAFWQPYDSRNERWKELKDHPSWWFGDTNKFPAWKELLEALNRVVARHPKTTFVCVHFANNAEELDWVEQSLARYPNLMCDLAARIPELGRHDPDKVRRLFVKYQDRILFATDFQVYDRLILGSSGNEPPPTDADAEVFFAKEWRWLETSDRNWPHMTPIQGDWNISSIHLPASVLRKIYFDNARKLLARSLPPPVLTARRISQDFEVDGRLQSPLWQQATAGVMDRASRSGAAVPQLATAVRALWSEKFLYLSFECPFTRLTAFQSPQSGRKRFDLNTPGVSLWDRDVVEAFIGTDTRNIRHYAEFEVAPTNERLDLMVLDLPEKDFRWTSGFQSSVSLDRKSRTWRCELRIPLEQLSPEKPAPGTDWRLNLFRCDRANRASLAWSPTLQGTFHLPERFGLLRFAD